jgi:hypothetical protein
MSSDGNIVAIVNTNDSIYIYKKNQSSIWVSFGRITSGEENGIQGVSLVMSGDGLTIAIGNPRGNGFGSVMVFKYSGVGTTWNTIAELTGETIQENMGGYHVNISLDGTIVSVGSPSYGGVVGVYRIGPTRTLDVNINKYYSLAYIMRVS